MPLHKAHPVKQDGRAQPFGTSRRLGSLTEADVHVRNFERVTYASGLPCFWQGGAPMVEAFEERSRIQSILKRGLDISASIAMLIFLMPLFFFVALVIKLSDPGPVFFRQPRMGLNGEKFDIFKFRTMHYNNCSIEGVEQTRENDVRITSIGKFLRRTSIDELPQFLNVLLGDMSLVGPRPHVDGQLAGGRPYSEIVPYYDMRLAMKPGITGWAQVNGLRGSTEDIFRARARIEHDVTYIQNASFILDLKILFLTLKNEFLSGSGS